MTILQTSDLYAITYFIDRRAIEQGFRNRSMCFIQLFCMTYSEHTQYCNRTKENILESWMKQVGYIHFISLSLSLSLSLEVHFFELKEYKNK